MGSQCSNIYNQISANTNTRDKFITPLSDNLTPSLQKPSKSNQKPTNKLDLKIQFIQQIQNQTILQGQPNILSFKKFTQNKYHIKFTDGSQYHGNLSQKGKRNNQGQQTWADGTKLITTWIENLPHGPGILISPNGFTFQGFWEQGIVQGYGKYYGKNGSYEGDWRDNQPHGFGIQTWEDGSKFQGSYHQGLKHGNGKYTWPDKSTYQGDWQQGQINGQGIYLYVDGRIYQGSFKDNKMQGKGIYTWPDGRKYIGSYEKDKKHGLGRYYWPDGKFFQGEWKSGNRHGYGQLVYPNGIVKQGIWQNDHKIQQNLKQNLKGQGHIVIQSTFANSEDKVIYQQRASPTFKIQRSRQNFAESSPVGFRSGSFGKKTKFPRTQQKPLYASSSSPYKELRQYYEAQRTQKDDINQRLLNRYSFINSSTKGFNQSQLGGNGKYSSKGNGKYSSKLKKPYQRKSKFFNHDSQILEVNRKERYSLG